MLETYITPLLMSYVDKYIKNLKPSDLSLSIWGGDVVLYNLELKLDVLEKELHLPITFLSGKIHKLQIHVPWTKLVSEPVEITINTIECVIQLKDPTFKHDDADTSSPLSALQAKEELDKEDLHDRGEPPPASYVQSLVNRVANNISICVHNVVLKYVEDDIVLSLNVKSAETFSVNANWDKAFVDIVAPEYILRKVCNISDLTICLDKKNTSGQIDMYQDPLLYKCGLSCRININYDAFLRPKSTKLNIYCECFDLSLTNEQLPLFVRLLKLCVSLYYGSLDLPGCEYKPHPAARMIEDKSHKASIPSVDSRTDTSLDITDQGTNLPEDDWYNWMWSFVPETTDENALETRPLPPDILVHIGIYISQVTFTLKLTHKVSEKTFLGAQRFQFKPMLNCELSGVAVEVILKGEEFFDVQLGVTSIMGWTIGECTCNHSDEINIKLIEDDEEEPNEKEESFLTMSAPQESPSVVQGFLQGSLFLADDQSTLKLPDLVFDTETFLAQHSESYGLQRYGAFFFDYLYVMDIEPDKDGGKEEEEPDGVDYVGKIRLVKEASHKRIFLGPTHLYMTTGLVHRLLMIYEFSSDETPDRQEKTDPFYDEFVEKQLLAGNISNRHFTITMLYLKVTVPAADHVKAGSILHPTTSVKDLYSINEKVDPGDDPTLLPALVLQVDRMEIHRKMPMYPIELCKLTIANAEFPAGKAMLQYALSNTVIEVFSVQFCLSHTAPGSPVLNIMPAVSLVLCLKECNLPRTWGNPIIKRNEAHLEVPSVSMHLTKPQLLLLTHLISTWCAAPVTNKGLHVLPSTVLDKVFESEDKGCPQSHMVLSLTNVDVEYCSTSVVMAATATLGTLSVTIRSMEPENSPKGAAQLITTHLIQGPCDTKDIYNGSLFSNSTYHVTDEDNLGPVLSLTVQLPRTLDGKDWKTPQGNLQAMETSNAFFLQIKGVAMSLDPLLYSWLDYRPSPFASSSGMKIDKERRGRKPSLTRTSSFGTPRKKSFARGHSSATSPRRMEDKKSPHDKSADSKKNDGDGSLDGSEALTFEAWLFDKLPLITTFAVQIDVRSVTVFIPEAHIPHEPQALTIAQNFAYQSWNSGTNSTPTPPSLVLCLPSLDLQSAHQNKVSFRPKLPLHLPRQAGKDSPQPDTLPWRLSAKNLAVYSVHSKTNRLESSTSPAVHFLVSPVSCTAVLASAKTSTSTQPVSSPRGPPGGSRGRAMDEGRTFPTLGFCVHTDFEPVVVSSSRKQISFLANLVEAFLHTVLSPAIDVTASPPTPGPGLHGRTMSVTSSSAVEHVEQENLSHSETSFTEIHQTLQDVKVSLWLQWTLPRLVVKLYGHTAKGGIPTCVTADLEDLTSFIDYQEAHLQMQYKVGAFRLSHAMKRDSKWLPGPFGGILFSCKDILSHKTSPLTLSPRLPVIGSQHDGAANSHGFLTLTYNGSRLHLKRRRSTSESSGKDSFVEELFKFQHEVRLAVQPFDIVVWSPAIIAAVDVFDARLLAKFKFLSPANRPAKSVHDFEKEAKEKMDAALSVDLLPLLFMNMREVRVFLPCSELADCEGDPPSLTDDLVVMYLSSITATPHPDNPIARSVVRKELHEQLRRFGRSSRHALGYDLHEVQYQTDFSGFGIWTAKWKELCGNLNKQSDMTTMDQNPALEWNTQLWRSAKEVHISQLLSGCDFKMVLAPAVTMAKAARSTRHYADSVPVCGWAVELNVVTNIDCFLSKSQIQLLQSLVFENMETIFCCDLLSSLSQPARSDSEFKMATLDGDHLDSGLGSSQTELTKEKQPPFEAFLAARKLSVRMYAQRAVKRRRSQHGSSLPDTIGRDGLVLTTKPVLQFEALQPAVTFKSHALGPRLQLWCYDISLMGCQLGQQGWLHKSLPEASDFNIECLRTRPGSPDAHTGVMPSFLAVDVRYLTNGAANSSIDVGRPLQVSFNVDVVSDVTKFLSDITVQSDSSGAPAPSTSATTPAVKYINLTTREISFEVSAGHGRDDYPKLLITMLGNSGSIRMRYGDQGKFPRLDANLEVEGLEIAFILDELVYNLLRPLTMKCELEMVSSPHSLTQTAPSLPQICCRLDIGFLQIDFGQHHLHCIAALSKVLQAFLHSQHEQQDMATTLNNGTTNEDNVEHDTRIEELPTDKSPIREEADLGFELLEECETDMNGVEDARAYEVDGVKQSTDDLRTGPFKYVMISGEVGLHHPEPFEILFTSDTRDRPPTMSWRYPEPRALATIEVLPLPFSSPVLVNTINMGDELRVPCVLSYWDNLQKCYVVYKEFFISEVSSCHISLPDPLTSDPATVIVAEEWQMTVDASIDIDYPDDSSFVDEDSGSSYSSPYRSLISATSLAASVKVNSVFSPSLIPVVSAQFSVSAFEIKILNHENTEKQVLPKPLVGYTLDPSVPTEQEFLLLTIEGLSGVTKHLGGKGAATLCHVEWNCHCELLDYGDLTYKRFVSPFDVSITGALFHGPTEELDKTPSQRSAWLEAGVNIGHVESVVSQSTVHTAALAVEAWTRHTRTETILFSHYVICNDTNEDIRLGQVDTDESILLASRHVLPYSWRTSRAVNIDPKLHVCFESEGDWRWSEPFDIDSLGVCARTIHHKLHSAVLIIDVIPMSGVQKQVIFRGGLQITSRLSVGVDLQILKNPTLGSGHTEKTPFQVHEDLSLTPNTTLPSYIVSHAGLVGMRIRIPNTTTWSEALPLDFNERKDDNPQHSVVKLLGVKTFQTFYLWYSVDKKLFEQVQITLSPLFIMRSHLPDPVLMNVFSAKTGSSSALEVLGKGREEQVLVLPPNSWHHLKFQFDNDGKTSNPSVPLNSTLIDLANKVNPDACDEQDRPLDTIWPYCGFAPKEKEEREPEPGNAPFVRHVVSSVSRTEATVREGQTISQQKVAAPFPDIELQCRVVKKWRHLSTLIVDVIPWCLLVNKTMATFYLRDLDTKVEIEVSSGQTIAPYKFKDQIQFGAHVAGSTSVSWSKPLTFLASTRDKDASTQPTDDRTHHVTISIAHVTRSARPLAVTWVMTSRLCCGVRVVCVEEKYCVVNSTTRSLMVLPALGASGKKIPCEVLQVERAIPLLANDTVRVPIAFWDVALTSSVVLDEEGVASLDDTTPVVFLALEEEFLRMPLTAEVQSSQRKWSAVLPVNSEAPRSAVSIPVRSERNTLPLIVTTKEIAGVTCIVIAVDASPRLTLHNDCPFTLQFGQTTPPRSPTYRPGSPEKVVVVEQMDPLFDVPEIPAFSSMHYELPMMREWFNKPGDVQPMPNIHMQGLYNVTVAEISEDVEAQVSHGQTTEVPQGWSHGFDISSADHVVVNLPGRGRAIIFVSKSRLCTIVRVKLYEESAVIAPSPRKSSPQSCELTVAVSKLDICLVNTHCKSPVEVLRATVCGISLCNSPSTDQSAFCELSLRLASFQLDNQLDGELFEFPVIVTTGGSGPIVQTSSRKPRGNNDAKPFLMINLQYEPSTGTGPIFLQSVVVTMEPVTVFLEDTLVYRLVGLAESFLPPQAKDSGATSSSSHTKQIVSECTSILNPLIIGEFTIQPLTIHLTLHASVKLFVAMDDTSLSLNQFHVCPVFAPGPTFAQRVFYHYLSSVIFKVGWVVGSLELLGSPAGLIRNFSRGLADFFYLPYDGLTRGPGAFVTGMSQGVSSFVRHVSTGALTSVTNLASSISRNLDRLCMDQDHIRLQEEQRCRRPTRLVTGIAHGLGGFGLSLLGAVAGVVDQPIQGIQRANDVKEAATGVLTGVGKGLLGVVTKPIGGAMELVSQTGQGILRETGLSHLPSRLHPVEESLVIESRNSQLKYSWKVLHLKSYQNLVLCIDATIVTTTGHDYSGALLLTSSTLYIVSSAVDSIQQSLHVANTDLQYDDEDNRLITVTTLLTTTNDDDRTSEIPDTGDRERMEQFLRDAHAYAQGSHSGSTVDESPGSFLTSRFVLLIDPVLRETVLAQFKTVKSKLLAETRLQTENIVT